VKVYTFTRKKIVVTSRLPLGKEVDCKKSLSFDPKRKLSIEIG